MWSPVIEFIESTYKDLSVNKKRDAEITLINCQIRFVDGINDDEYEAWKSILKKVKAYNAEHE